MLKLRCDFVAGSKPGLAQPRALWKLKRRIILSDIVPRRGYASGSLRRWNSTIWNSTIGLPAVFFPLPC